MPPHPRREEIVAFLKTLRERIIARFEQFEPSARFKRTPWSYQGEGGGEIALLRGAFFEKGAVNWSAIAGTSFPMDDGQGPFFATGVSLITHMMNPHAPTAHFNIRFIETQERYWFAGGYDLTPMGFPYDEDTAHFHRIAKENLDRFGQELYPRFSKAARDYFFIPHRKKERGVGGLFFDGYKTDDFEQDFALWKSVGNSFLEALIPIYSKRVGQSYTEQDRERQLHLRSHYVEFNLLYDRGTKFGFLSGGNPDAILCSMPPLVKW